MSEKTSMMITYSIVYTTFNFVISFLYYIYGWIVFKKRYVKLSHSHISKEQKKYLSKIKFVNIHRNWLKKYYKKLRDGSVLYFVLSEIICLAAIYFTERYLLVCRISLVAAILLFLFWIFLLFYFRKNSLKLAAQHKENLKKALDEFEKLKETEQEV